MNERILLNVVHLTCVTFFIEHLGFVGASTTFNRIIGM